jgi:hypothetical protein
MPRLCFRHLPTALSACAAALAIAACTGTTQFVSEWRRPDFDGPPLGRLFVIAATSDPLVRRVFEDAVVAQLVARGSAGVPSYRYFPEAQPAASGALQSALAASRSDGVLLARADHVAEQTQIVPGTVVPVYLGVGWDGFYDSYNATWLGNYVRPADVTVTRKLVAETRAFRALDHALVWSGTTQTPLGGGATTEATIDSIADTLVRALAHARVI